LHQDVPNTMASGCDGLAHRDGRSACLSPWVFDDLVGMPVV